MPESRAEIKSLPVGHVRTVAANTEGKTDRAIAAKLNTTADYVRGRRLAVELETVINVRSMPSTGETEESQPLQS